jgi:hypothetical protein
MVSVIVIDTLYYDLGYLKKTIETLGNKITKVYWFSDIAFPEENFSVPVVWTPIEKITNYFRDYSNVALRLCPKICVEKYNLTIHKDGFAVNSDAWTDEFYEYDYIGASWSEGVVGNGGFTLRSKKLYDALADMNMYYDPTANEDDNICRVFRGRLESDYGIKFAPKELADRFSIEYAMNSPWLGKSLGFHGKHGVHKHYGVEI